MNSSSKARTQFQEDQSQDTSHDRVHVVVRLRPPIAEDIASRGFMPDGEEFWSGARVTGKNSLSLSKSAIYDEREFTFDKVLDLNARQEEAYESIASPVVQDVLAGYHGTILSYGQTGSGKTFTTFGSTSYWAHPMAIGAEVGVYSTYFWNAGGSASELWDGAGVIPRAACDIFNYVHETTSVNRTSQFRVSVSFFEVYLETINDLLDNSKTNLSVREDPRTGVFIDGLTSIAVSSPMQLLQHIQDGASLRATSATRMVSKFPPPPPFNHHLPTEPNIESKSRISHLDR